MSSEQEELRQRAVELGFLSEAQAAQAWQRFLEAGEDADLGDYLLEQGLITLEQLAELQPADEGMDATLYGDEPAGDPLLDQTFSGCRVERKLGQGGMGAVYLARRESDGAEVVIKFLAQEQAANRTWRGRFVREAEVMMRVTHPNVVGVYALEGEGPTPHIVMEYLDGTPLDEVLLEQGALEPLEAARLARDAARGLAHAHSAGIIHRDIKPANLFLTRAGELKILDFGLAKNVEVDDGLSMPGQVLGTPHYMAPEQWGDHRVDARCDVFSLGATLYHLVTGQLPFPGRTPQAISRQMHEGQLVAPRALVPEVPEELELVIYRMMATDRELRYQGAEACAVDLERAIRGERVDVPCLVEVGGPRDGRRYPLLPGASFLIGREGGNQVVIEDRSVSRQHARIDRGKTGFVLHDLGSSYGSFVGGMRVREVALKDQDEVKLGKVTLRFRDGGLTSTRRTARVSKERQRVRTHPWPVVRALMDAGDRRVVVPLLELLAPDVDDARLRGALSCVRFHLGGELAEQAGQRARAALRKRKLRAPQTLFTITHENLSDDAEAWLEWWGQARASYPPQLAPQRPAAPSSLAVVRGEPQPRVIPLGNDRAELEIGRDESFRVSLQNRSVSRHHATLVRLHQRLVIRDEGSRFGTLVNGARVREAFLKHGDRIVLGQAELEFMVDDPDSGATVDEGEGVTPLEHTVFFALVELRHPATALGLARLAVQGEDLGWVDVEAESLFPGDEAGASRLAAAVRKLYGREAETARELLPELLGEARPSGAEYLELVAARQAELPPQLLPEGWFPDPV